MDVPALENAGLGETRGWHGAKAGKGVDAMMIFLPFLFIYLSCILNTLNIHTYHSLSQIS